MEEVHCQEQRTRIDRYMIGKRFVAVHGTGRICPVFEILSVRRFEIQVQENLPAVLAKAAHRSKSTPAAFPGNSHLDIQGPPHHLSIQRGDA